MPSSFGALVRDTKPRADERRLTIAIAAGIAGFALMLAMIAPAGAQSWPSKPVTMVVSNLMGTGPDIVGRFLAERLRERTGQPFSVENRPGGTGIVGAQQVRRAAPDGYTILLGTLSTATNVHLYRNLGYDPIKDFTPVTTIAMTSFVLLVNPAVMPVNSVAELTEYIRKHSSKLAYASGGAAGRVAAELYFSLSGLRPQQVTFVPYKGGSQAFTDLIGGQIHFLFADSAFGIQQARGDKARALALTSVQRTSAAPDIPTMAEAGVPGYSLGGWFALFMPANSPKAIAQKLAELCNAAMTSEAARAFLKNLATDPYPGSPGSLAMLLESEIAKWGRIIKSAGMEPD